MEFKILKNSKEEMEVELGNLTLVELLRVYLNQDQGVHFAAWRRDHPTEKPILKFTTKGKTAKKAFDGALSSVLKDLDKLESEFKKIK